MSDSESESFCIALLDIRNDLLDFSKIEANRMELESLPFQPAQEIEAVLSLLRPKAQSKKLRLEARLAPASGNASGRRATQAARPCQMLRCAL